MAEKAIEPNYEQTHLSNRYTPLSVIALAFTTTHSWVAFSSGVAVPLSCGSGPGIIYGLIAGGVIMGIIGLGFAELASAYPSAGGQYHIVHEVFSPGTRRAGAFFTGWLTVIYIMAAMVSCNIFVASSVLDLVSLWDVAYTGTAWQTYLVHVLLCVVAFCATARFPGAIGRLGIGVFWLSLVGFVASMATLLAVKRDTQSAETVFRTYENTSGWSDGWAMIIGITACLWAYSGLDGATHLAEEVPNPSRTVPVAILLTMGLGIVTVVGWNITLMFVVTDVDAIINSTVPILEVYNQALDSRVATTVWTVFYMAMFYEIVLNLFIFAGRTIWSLARDGGMPFSSFLARLHWSSPVRAMVVMLLLQVVIGILYIVSSTAYSSFINLTLFALNITFALPQAALLFRGRQCLPERAFSLGKYGYGVNLVATLFVVLFSVTFCFPTATPVSPSSMNYLVVVVGIALLVPAALWWGGLNKTFK